MGSAAHPRTFKNRPDLAAPSVIDPAEVLAYCPGDVWLDTTDQRWGRVAARGFKLNANDIWIPAVSSHLLVMYRDGATPMARRLEGPTKETQVERGDVSMMSAGLPSEWAWRAGIDVLHLYIEPRLLRQVARDMYEKDVGDVALHDVLKVHDPVLIALGDALLREARIGDAGSRLSIEAMSQQICVHLLRHYGDLNAKPVDQPQGGLNAAVRRRLESLMHERLCEPLSLATLAEAAGVSAGHFSRLFQASFGVSPHQHLLELRLQRARTMLQRQQGSIAEIAASTGFSDQSHLTRRFRLRFGITPAVAARG